MRAEPAAGLRLHASPFEWPPARARVARDFSLPARGMYPLCGRSVPHSRRANAPGIASDPAFFGVSRGSSQPALDRTGRRAWLRSRRLPRPRSSSTTSPSATRGATSRPSTTCRSTIPAGEICMLVGPSGGGKTTALKLVNRLIDFDEGDILIGDQSVRSLEPTELRRADRLRDPAGRAVPAHDGRGQHRHRAAAAGLGQAADRRARARAARARRARPRARTRSATRRSSPAASASASGWRARWRRTRS